VLQFVV